MNVIGILLFFKLQMLTQHEQKIQHFSIQQYNTNKKTKNILQNTTLTKSTEFHFTKTLTKHINRKQHIRKSCCGPIVFPSC